jgi:hypothetical protein
MDGRVNSSSRIVRSSELLLAENRRHRPALADGQGRPGRCSPTRFLFQHGYNDTANAFKAYRRYVIDQLQPLLSDHFNLTVEMPLKAVVRGFNFAVVPVSWTNRQHGASKLPLQEMGSRYAFIVAYVWLEHHLSRGDYRRQDVPIDPT